VNDDKQGGAYVGGRWVSTDELRQHGRRVSGAFADGADDRPRPVAYEDDDLGRAVERARRARIAFQEMLGQTSEPHEERVRELRDEIYAAEGEVALLILLRPPPSQETNPSCVKRLTAR
jgi:hypothetical protein